MRRFWFAVVNAVTLSSLAAGMVAIFLASRGRVSVAAGCLLACVVLDGLDGALARKLKVSSPFGTQMDSLADMCSFGLATAVVVFASLDARTSPWLAGAACVAVTCAAALRLARFNVSARSSEYFIGVPTTISAATLSVGVLLYPQAPGALVVFAVAALAMAMVSSFPYLTLAKLVRMPWLLAVGAALSLFDLSLGFGVSVGVYLLSGPVLWWRTRPAPHADPSSLH